MKRYSKSVRFRSSNVIARIPLQSPIGSEEPIGDSFPPGEAFGLRPGHFYGQVQIVSLIR